MKNINCLLDHELIGLRSPAERWRKHKAKPPCPAANLHELIHRLRVKVIPLSEYQNILVVRFFQKWSELSTIMSMITATAWVPRGVAAQFPTRFELNEEEFSRIAKLAKLQLDDAKEDLEEVQNAEKVESNGNSNGIAVSNTNG